MRIRQPCRDAGPALLRSISPAATSPPREAFPRHRPPDRDHGRARARPAAAVPGTSNRTSAPSRPIRSRKPTRSPTPSRAAISTTSRTNSATCCCRSSSTPAWPRSKAPSISAMSSRPSPPSSSAAIRTSSATPTRETAEAVEGLWERSRPRKRPSAARRRQPARLAGVPVALPALTRAVKLQDKAVHRRLRLERSARGAGQDPRGSRRDRSRARSLGDRATRPPRSAICSSRWSISRATSAPIRKACLRADQRQIRAPLRRDRARAGRARQNAQTRRSTRWTRSGTRRRRRRGSGSLVGPRIYAGSTRAASCSGMRRVIARPPGRRHVAHRPSRSTSACAMEPAQARAVRRVDANSIRLPLGRAALRSRRAGAQPLAGQRRHRRSARRPPAAVRDGQPRGRSAASRSILFQTSISRRIGRPRFRVRAASSRRRAPAPRPPRARCRARAG